MQYVSQMRQKEGGMASRITESVIEELAIELLKNQGYGYCAGPDIAPDGEQAERKSFEDVLLLDRLTRVVRTINPGVPVDAQADAIKQIQRFGSQELIVNNEAFHRMLTGRNSGAV
jgi:type I restriction enzyme R subunit